MDINNLEKLNQWASQLNIEQIKNLSEDELLNMVMERSGHAGQFGFMLQLQYFKSQEHFAETMNALMERLQKVDNLKEKMQSRKKDNSDDEVIALIRTKEPIQCHLWQKENITSDDLDFEIVEKIIDSSHFQRYIVRCKQCGQLYWDEWYEQVNFDGGDDKIEQIYIPLERYNIEEIKGKTPLIAVLDYTPRLISDSKETNKFKWIGK